MASELAINLRIDLDPWGQRARTAAPEPEELTLFCVYDLNIGADDLPEAVYFRRCQTHDELWTAILDWYVDSHHDPIGFCVDELHLAVRAERSSRPGRG